MKSEFDSLVLEVFGADETLASTRFRVQRVRNIMCEKHKFFLSLTPKQQLDLSMTVVRIAVSTSMRDMCKVSAKKIEDGKFELSIDAGYQPL